MEEMTLPEVATAVENASTFVDRATCDYSSSLDRDELRVHFKSLGVKLNDLDSVIHENGFVMDEFFGDNNKILFVRE